MTGSLSMPGSLRALLDSVIDYAGLFPPASLPLEAALRDYAQFRQLADAWMLGQFVVPAKSLGKLGPLAEPHVSGRPWDLAAIGSAAADRDAVLATLRQDLIGIGKFNKRFAERAAVLSLELGLPAHLASRFEVEACTVFLDGVAAQIEDSGVELSVLFIEASLVGDWQASLMGLVSALAERSWRFGYPVGLKLRTGGLEAVAFPTTQQVAAVIRACRVAHLRWKATAGLHHPLRRFAPEVATDMHGFLNVLAAAVLGHAHDLDDEVLVAILEDRSPTCFEFGDEEFSWQGRRATLSEIRRARQDGMVSFGSCSFTEPREELTELVVGIAR